MSSKPLATLFQMSKQLKDIRQFHTQGCESLASKVSLTKQAEDLGWNRTKLDKARKFAMYYSEADLEALFKTLTEHRPIFGLAHIYLLVTLHGSLETHRIEFQNNCVVHNWSMEQLQNKMQIKFGSRSTRPGRRPDVTPENVNIVFESEAKTFYRLVKEIQRNENGKQSIWKDLPKAMRQCIESAALYMKPLGDQASVELAKQRKKK